MERKTFFLEWCKDCAQKGFPPDSTCDLCLADMPKYKVRGRVVENESRVEIFGCWKLASKNPKWMNTIVWSRKKPHDVFDLRIQAPNAQLAQGRVITEIRKRMGWS